MRHSGSSGKGGMPECRKAGRLGDAQAVREMPGGGMNRGMEGRKTFAALARGMGKMPRTGKARLYGQHKKGAEAAGEGAGKRWKRG